ncbi:MAG: YqaA family protein [Alphaproteobacteria bacterium]
MIIKQTRKLYDWVLELSRSPRATMWLMIVAFTESIFFPIPQDVMLIPMMLANRAKAYYYALMATIASVVGGLAGYFIGLYLYNEIAVPILEVYGYMDKMETFKTLYQDNGFWVVFAGGFTPVPYKVITITSGAMELGLIAFISAAVLSRVLRFFGLAVLISLFGEPILKFIDKYFAILTILFFVILLGGFFLIGLLV